MALVYANNIRKHIAAMLDAFNNLLYPDGDSVNELIVPIRYSSASRLLGFYNDIEQRRKYDINLPVMSLDITSIDPNNEDQGNKENVYLNCSGTQYLLEPAVYDLTWDLTLFCREDCQNALWIIIEQVLSKFITPMHYPFTAYKFTDGSKINYSIPIKLQATSKNFDNVPVLKGEPMALKFTFTFLTTFRIFKSSPSDSKLINTIDITFENEINHILSNVSLYTDSGDVVRTEINP